MIRPSSMNERMSLAQRTGRHFRSVPRKLDTGSGDPLQPRPGFTFVKALALLGFIWRQGLRRARLRGRWRSSRDSRPAPVLAGRNKQALDAAGVGFDAADAGRHI